MLIDCLIEGDETPPEALDSADEGSLTPPRFPLDVHPADPFDLDRLRRLSIRLSPSPLPDPLPDPLPVALPVALPVSPAPRIDIADAPASCPVQDSSSSSRSTTISCSLIQTSSALSTVNTINYNPISDPHLHTPPTPHPPIPQSEPNTIAPIFPTKLGTAICIILHKFA